MDEIKKVYFTVKEIAHELELPQSTIRYWADTFSFLKGKKTKTGRQYFTKLQLEDFKTVKFLIKEQHYTIERTKVYFEKKSTSKDQDLYSVLLQSKILLTKLRSKF